MDPKLSSAANRDAVEQTWWLQSPTKGSKLWFYLLQKGGIMNDIYKLVPMKNHKGNNNDNAPKPHFSSYKLSHH